MSRISFSSRCRTESRPRGPADSRPSCSSWRSASRRVPRLICSISESSVSTRCRPGSSSPLVMAVLRADSACSRRLFFSSPSSGAVSPAMAFVLNVISRLFTVGSNFDGTAESTAPAGTGTVLPAIVLLPGLQVSAELGEDLGHDAVHGQAVAVMQGGQRAGVQELVRQRYRHYALAKARGDDGGGDGFEQAAHYGVVFQGDGQAVRV